MAGIPLPDALSRNGSARAAVNRRLADEWALYVAALVEGLRREGFITLEGQARELNRRGQRTRQGRRPWSAQNLYLVLRRARGITGAKARHRNDVRDARLEQWFSTTADVTRNLLSRGVGTQAVLAKQLNMHGSRTAHGKLWTQRAVSRLLRRMA